MNQSQKISESEVVDWNVSIYLDGAYTYDETFSLVISRMNSNSDFNVVISNFKLNGPIPLFSLLIYG